MEPSDASVRPRTGPRRTTVAIVACCAVIATLLTALVAVSLRNRDSGSTAEKLDPTGTLPIPQPENVDGNGILRAELEVPGGGTATLASLRGDKPLLVNLWASTCVPCVEEMPLLDQVSTSDPDLTVIGVALEPSVRTARTRAESTGITYRWLHDPKMQTSLAANVVNIPDTFLFSADGRLLGAKAGPFRSKKEIQDWIASHLEAGP